MRANISGASRRSTATASPMVMNSRSTADRMRRLVRYASTSTPWTAIAIASQASTTSRTYARTSCCIKNLLRAIYLSGDVAILDRVAHDQVDLRAQQPARLIEQPEVRVDESEWVHWAELHEQVDVALSLPEVVTQRRAEHE